MKRLLFLNLIFIFLTLLGTIYVPQSKAANITLTLDLPAGWSMISLPIVPVDRTVGALFPEAVAVYGFEQTYQLIEPDKELAIGKGYWLYLPSAKSYCLTGAPITTHTHNAPSGWSMIGACSYPAQVSVSDGRSIEAIFNFNKKYRFLDPESYLEAGQGYWIYLNEAGLITSGKEIIGKDLDQDGFLSEGSVCSPIDCDDSNPDAYPGASEVCDGLDQDCDGNIDEGVQNTYYEDFDEDNYGNPNKSLKACVAPPGYTLDGLDCDDKDPLTFPKSHEVCGDGLDQDCDGFDTACLLSLQASPDEILINTPTTITISSKLDPNSPLPVEMVEMLRIDPNGQSFSTYGLMYDDGTHGDLAAADHVFTGQFEINDPAPNIYRMRIGVTYRGQTDPAISEGKLIIDVYRQVINEEVNALFTSGDTLDTNFTNYSNQYDQETAQNLILQDALADENIERASVKDGILTVFFKSGIVGILSLRTEEEEILGGSFNSEKIDVFSQSRNIEDQVELSLVNDSESQSLFSDPKPKNPNIGIYSACFHEMYDYILNKNNIFEKAKHMSFGNIKVWGGPSNPEDASVEAIQEWGNYGIIIANSHGHKFSECDNQCGLQSATPVSDDPNDEKYKDAINKKLLVNLGLDCNGKRTWVIMPSYIEEHCPKLPDTVFFFMCCDIMNNSSFFDALADKGGKAFFGFRIITNSTNNVSIFSNMMGSMLPESCEKEPKTALEAFETLGLLGRDVDGFTFAVRYNIPSIPYTISDLFKDEALTFRDNKIYRYWGNDIIVPIPIPPSLLLEFGYQGFKFITDEDGDGLSDLCDSLLDPEAEPDTASVNEGSFVIIEVLNNDKPGPEFLTITNVTNPDNGMAKINSASPPDESTITYTPDINFIGIDSFLYTITNNSTGVTDVSSVVVTVICVKPRAIDDPGSGPGISVNSGGSVIINVLANDYDPDGDVLCIDTVSAPAKGTANKNEDGTITYTSGASNEFCDTTDSFTYTITDGEDGQSTATVTVMIKCPLEAVPDSASVNEGSSVNINVLANDKPDPAILSIVEVTDPAYGTADGNTDKTITYTPDEDFCGTDSFQYTITDGENEKEATVIVMVKCVLRAVDDSASVDEGSFIIIPVLANDRPDPASLSIAGIFDPNHGTVFDNQDGTITYMPDEDFCGTDSFIYAITDGEEGSTDEAMVTIKVCPVEAIDDTASVDEGGSVTIDVLANDEPDPACLTITAISDPNHGTVTKNLDMTITYKPADDFWGTDSFTYTIADNEGATDEATVTVTVNAGVITFADANLEACVREHLGIGADVPITKEMALGLTGLFCVVRGIEKLDGLEYFINLLSLDLQSNNNINDISALANLTNLTVLDLDRNNITDISVLANLINLSNLWLQHNNITDISALANLTKLTTLALSDNNINDISVLANLTNLSNLWLQENNITDISALADHTNLTTLWLQENNITDISALANLTKLTTLALSDNNINDISALAGLTNLLESTLSYNNISDISALIANTGLGSGDLINLWGNPIIKPIDCWELFIGGCRVNNIISYVCIEEKCQAEKETINGKACADVQTLRSRGVTVYVFNEFFCPEK